MVSEMDELQDRYDDLLLKKDKTADDWEEIYRIEQQIREMLFPHPRREDFTDEEWHSFYPEFVSALEAYDERIRAERTAA